MATTTVPVESNDITIFKADSATIRCSVVKASDGSVMPLTGYAAKMSVKREQYDNDADAVFTLTGVVTEATGICTFTVTTSNSDQRPGTYYYDVQVVKTSTTKTVASGKFIIQWDVTRSTS